MSVFMLEVRCRRALHALAYICRAARNCTGVAITRAMVLTHGMPTPRSMAGMSMSSMIAAALAMLNAARFLRSRISTRRDSRSSSASIASAPVTYAPLNPAAAAASRSTPGETVPGMRVTVICSVARFAAVRSTPSIPPSHASRALAESASARPGTVSTALSSTMP